MIEPRILDFGPTAVCEYDGVSRCGWRATPEVVLEDGAPPDDEEIVEELPGEGAEALGAPAHRPHPGRVALLILTPGSGQRSLLGRVGPRELFPRACSRGRSHSRVGD